jgi:putative ATP-dependent endonuclease of OLD family
LDFSDFTVFVGENNVGKTNILMAILKILKMDESPRRTSFNEDDFFLDSSGKRSNEIIIEIIFDSLDENDQTIFVSRGIDLVKDQIAIRLEAKWEESNKDASVEIYYHRLDDIKNPKGDQFQFNDKKYIPFYYINAYRDIWRETQYTTGDLKQIFKNYNKQFLKPLNIQILNCINNIESLLATEKISLKIKAELVVIKRLLNENNLDDIETRTNSLSELKSEEEFHKIQGIISILNNIIKRNSIRNKLLDLQTSINGIEEIKKIKEMLNKNLSLFIPIKNLDIELLKFEEDELFDESKIYLENLPILKYGSGFQNSFVMAIKICRLLADMYSSEEKISNLFIAIEEPEAHMHPHLERSLINKLKAKQEELKRDGLNIQIILTTHSPFILSKVKKSDLRLISRIHDNYKVIKFDDSFMQDITRELSLDKLKHFDFIFRSYPEIFLSKGVILVEGRSEFGAMSEFFNKFPDADLDDLGLTIIQSESSKTTKFVYLIIKKFSKCISIRDNDPDPSLDDDSLIKDPNEKYYKTDFADFEEEIVNSVSAPKIVKIILNNFPEKSGPILHILKTNKLGLEKLNVSQILQKIDTLPIDALFSKSFLTDFLRTTCKSAFFWSIFCSELSFDNIPECYKKIITEAKTMVS